MFKTASLDFKSSGVLNPLVLDYISKKKDTSEFYEHYPDIEGFRKFTQENPYNSIDRKTLHKALSAQAEKVNNTTKTSRDNIELLKSENVYTVTTGHQLCLFTGPLYFIYKIFSAIRLAERLTKEIPGKKFVPVYWMASEDHDFAEVNHFNTPGGQITWSSAQTGMVGDFKTDGLKKEENRLNEFFGGSERGDHLLQLFRGAYTEHPNLADATRWLVNSLFGDYGLVIADGNDRSLKNLFKDLLKKDIFESSVYRNVEKTIKSLKEKDYLVQVNPRPVNCFFLEEGIRERIEKQNENYTLVGSGKVFSQNELMEIIERSPEKISPNVVLRPLYQQTILPNIAYVGGPGELAYWLEFKKMFNGENVIFPILVPRTFITVIEKHTQKKIGELGFKVEDVFSSNDELIRRFIGKEGKIMNLEEEKTTITEHYNKLQDRIVRIDKTLEGNVAAELKKVLNGMDAIAAKANRAMKRQSETEIAKIGVIKEKLFPGGTPQERVENFSSFYIKFGEDFFKSVYDVCDPLELKYKVLLEEE